MTNEEKRAWAVSQLLKKREQTGETPKKSDFDAPDLSRIKAFLGPWPRALEAAGLKEGAGRKSKTSHKRKTREKKKDDEKN